MNLKKVLPPLSKEGKNVKQYYGHYFITVNFVLYNRTCNTSIVIRLAFLHISETFHMTRGGHF